MNFYTLYHSLNTLLPLYSQPHRHYHNFQHIAYMLEGFADLKRERGNFLSKADEAIVYDIILWHDAYWQFGDNNEAESAKLYDNFVDEMMYQGFQITEHHIGTVKTGILETKNHFKPRSSSFILDQPIQVALDLDLLGFAAPYEQFKLNNDNLAKEMNKTPNDPGILNFLSHIKENIPEWLGFKSFVDKGLIGNLHGRSYDNLCRYLDQYA